MVKEYLKENHSKIDLKDENRFKDLEIIDSDLKGKEVFFTAEIHGVKANAELEMKFLKYFKEKTDFKYYLLENSYSNAYFINKYLETGDIQILEEIYEPLKGTFAWNKSNYNQFKNLYEYNKSLPESKKIKVLGVDIEHSTDNAYRFLLDILPEKEVPDEIKENIENIQNTFEKIDNPRDQVAYESSLELQKDILEKESIYKKYLGEDFFGFEFVNKNVIYAFEAYKYQDDYFNWNNTRDKMIYKNFEAVREQLPKGKYYGQWGMNHTYQSEENHLNWFGSYLNQEESEFKDKVLTIIYNYDNCNQMNISKDRSYEEHKFNLIFPEIKQTNDLIDNNITIYKLNSKGTPFSDIKMSSDFNNEKLEKNMLEFFQYIVAIKNSESTEPLRNRETE
ncbi:MAG: erythromycin esterase family protein [Tissierella sp.]|uniref:erythromycin esterase family protein n=1 Tax=Tissierella sp. TaxID=41274 RepID=UPI003F95A8F5